MAANKSRGAQPYGVYEEKQRLMDKDDVNLICQVVGLDKGKVNNSDLLPEPGERVGAGRVREFAPEDKQTFLQRQGDSKSAIEDRPKAVPRFSELGSITNAKQWPGFATAYDFTITKDEIIKRAAWTWYRTGLLYERTAQQLRVEGVPQRALGLSTLGSSARHNLIECVKTLRERAERAKAHALKLFPLLLDEESISSPSWAEEYSQEDIKYYQEMSENHELFMRHSVGYMYRRVAQLYIKEALLEYLEPIEARRAQQDSKGLRDEITVFASAMISNGGLVKLWAKAAAASKDDKEFRRWWLRAAMARGHAEWLEKEPYFQYSSQSPGARPPLLGWRLLDPPHPASYVHDCMIVAMAALTNSTARHGDKAYKEDTYDTAYNSAKHAIEETSNNMYGSHQASGLFGAPDFVYHETSSRGWATDKFGLIPDPFDLNPMNKITMYQDRYERKGVYDVLPRSATAYEKALAVCADDVAFEWSYRTTLSMKCRTDEWIKSPNVQQVVDEMLTDVGRLVNRRKWMTQFDADLHDFHNAISTLISGHTARINTGEESLDVTLWLKLHSDLNEILMPWLHVQPYVGLSGKWLWAIAPVGRELKRPDSKSPIETINMFVQMGRLMYTDRTVETIRGKILKDENIMKTSDEFALARCFRDYLETGREENMPHLAMGTHRRRELTMVEFEETCQLKCKPGCDCALDTQRALRKLLAMKRKSNMPAMVAERAKIRAWFNKTMGPQNTLPITIMSADPGPTRGSSARLSLADLIRARQNSDNSTSGTPQFSFTFSASSIPSGQSVISPSARNQRDSFDSGSTTTDDDSSSPSIPIRTVIEDIAITPRPAQQAPTERSLRPAIPPARSNDIPIRLAPPPPVPPQAPPNNRASVFLRSASSVPAIRTRAEAPRPAVTAQAMDDTLLERSDPNHLSKDTAGQGRKKNRISRFFKKIFD